MNRKTSEATLKPGDPEPIYRQCQFCEHFYRFNNYAKNNGSTRPRATNECSVRGFAEVDPLGGACYMYKPNMSYMDFVKRGIASYLVERKPTNKKTKCRWKKTKVVKTAGELAKALENVDPDTSLAVLFGAHKNPERASGFVSVETKNYSEATPLELYLYTYKHETGQISTPALLITNYGSDINIRANLGALTPRDLEDK